jgi:hypothetical protein
VAELLFSDGEQAAFERLPGMMWMTMIFSLPSIHDEKLCANSRVRTVRLCAVGHLVTDPGPQYELSAIRKLRVELALDAKKDMTLCAPVVGEVTRRILDHAHPDIAKLPGTPVRDTGLTLVLGRFDRRPICSSEWDIRELHRMLLRKPRAKEF